MDPFNQLCEGTYIDGDPETLGQWRSAWITRLVQYVTAPCYPALSMAVQGGSEWNTKMLIIAQCLNAVKPKLMIGWEGTKIIITQDASSSVSYEDIGNFTTSQPTFLCA